MSIPFENTSGRTRDVPGTFGEGVAEAADAGDPGLRDVAWREVPLPGPGEADAGRRAGEDNVARGQRKDRRQPFDE
jgi:hypothetical protein